METSPSLISLNWLKMAYILFLKYCSAYSCMFWLNYECIWTTSGSDVRFL